MQNQEQQQMFDVLEQQRQQQQRMDRVFKVVLPITAFLLSVISANLNWQSTLGTFIMLWVAFVAVGIKRQDWRWWLLIVAIYVLIDHYFSFAGQFSLRHLRLQMSCMIIFTAAVALGRPYIDRWAMKKASSAT